MCVPHTSIYIYRHTHTPSFAHWTPYIYHTHTVHLLIFTSGYVHNTHFQWMFWTTKFNVFKLLFSFICFHTTLISIILFLQTILILKWLFQFTLFHLHNQGFFYKKLIFFYNNFFDFNLVMSKNLGKFFFFHFVRLEKNKFQNFPKSCGRQNLFWRVGKKDFCVTHNTHHPSDILFLQTTHTLQCFDFLWGAQIHNTQYNS